MVTTQKEIFAQIADKTGFTQKDVKTIYSALVDVVKESANSAEESTTILPGIGKLIVYVKAPYTAKNPRTGQPIDMPASRRSRFRINPSFSKEITNGEVVAPAPKKPRVIKK